MKLLDTPFLVDHQRGDASVASFLEEQEKKNETVVTSTINLKEISVGKMLVEEPTPRFDEILGDFGWLEVEPFKEEHALEASRIEAEMRESNDYDLNLSADILIAGTARKMDAAVVTRNISDFERTGVETVMY
ncbi:MAG: PIN domain-containing protein [Halobacteriales archaeon]|nr:PIN domain-containing protein [Halobacteriales archaeon]